MQLKSLVIFTAFLVCAQVVSADAPERHKRTPVYTENGIEDCLRCHSGEKMRAIRSSPHGNADHHLSPAAGHGCESCHGPGSIHISRAHGGRGFPPLIQFGRGRDAAPREDQLQACLGCHAREDAPGESIGFIGSAHDVQRINCSTCHEAHAVIDPMNALDEQFSTCRRCHRKEVRNHPRVDDKDVDFDAEKCSECHDVHPVIEASG